MSSSMVLPASTTRDDVAVHTWHLTPCDMCCVLCCLQTDPLRKFYTSLLKEKPDSAMALKW